jgi:hypothetical protein
MICRTKEGKFKIGTRGTQSFDTYCEAVSELKSKRIEDLKRAFKKLKAL